MLSHSDLLLQACLVGGDWIAADDGGALPVLDPASGEKLGAVPNLGRAETRRAIEAAAAALPGWRKLGARARSDLMFKLYQALLDNADALGRLLTLEQGKPLAEATGEVVAGANYIRWFAEEARRVYGDTIPSPWPERRILVTKEPVGVVGAITPWNFPSSMIARKLGAALGAGCTIVIKPASLTPFSGLAFGKLAEMVGFPAGVVNIVTGKASEIAAEMCEHPKLAKITFTGSTETGKRLASQATAHMKRVSMELGGNAPFLVFDDADLERAVAGAVLAKFRNGGQTCVATNRFIVAAGIHDAFTEAFAAEVQKLAVGAGLEQGAQVGPLIDEAAVNKVEEHIADIAAGGGRIVLGGRRHARGGCFFEPTVATGVTGRMKVANEETFGPLAPIFRVENEAEAIALANATEYGLAAYAYTSDLGRAFRVSEALEYGLVGVNEGLISTEVAPFGGFKQSGMGKEGSKYGLDDYLNVKYTCLGGLGL